MSKILYIAEGETEERFIKFLTQNDFIQPGRFKKFNLMQKKIQSSDSLLSKRVDKIYCILDTDVKSKDNVETLLFNLKKLKGISSGADSILSLIQCDNFEDELAFVFSCSDLGKFLKVPHNTKKDLKTFLAQKIMYNNYITRENLIRYCTRPDNFKTILQEMNFQPSKICIETIEKCMI